MITYGLDRAPQGIGRYVVELLRALAALPNGPEILLLTTEREDSVGLWDRFEHHPLPGCQRLPSLLTSGNLAVSDAIRRYRLDLVHDPNGIAPFLGPQAAARRVVTIHDAFAYVVPETHNRLDNWRYRYHLPYAARRADAVITNSECSRRDVTRFLGLCLERVQTVHMGVNHEFKPETREACLQAVLARYAIKQPYLLYVGGINPRKNIARLFEAYAQVRTQHPDLSLVITGKRQWQTGEIDAAFKRFDLENHVHFTGYVDGSDLPALYSAAQVFVFPSLYEGFGLPPLEAMACGTPVVTSNTSSLPEVVGNAALLVDPDKVSEIAGAINQLLVDAALAADLRARGRQQAREFTWENTARQTVAIYEQVMNGFPSKARMR